MGRVTRSRFFTDLRYRVPATDSSVCNVLLAAGAEVDLFSNSRDVVCQDAAVQLNSNAAWRLVFRVMMASNRERLLQPGCARLRGFVDEQVLLVRGGIGIQSRR
jgi:hypothetical protein